MSAPWFLFNDAIVLRVSGKDARRYLNNRLSNDLRTLQPGESVSAAALTAQGRVEGLFTIFAQPDETFFLVCDGGPREEVTAALKRFIVADRVLVEDVSAQSSFVHLAASADDSKQILIECGQKLLLVAPKRRVAETGSDCLVVGDASREAPLQLEAKCGAGLAASDYRLRRMRKGIPSFPEEINGEILLTEAGMRESVSFAKGCYVGQEVIERSDAIGKVPRTLELVRLTGTAEVAPGTALLNATGEALGKAVSSVADPENSSTFLFALLRTGKYGSSERLECAGLAGEIVPRQLTAKGA
jgi:folate-binding protein YgfZ